MAYIKITYTFSFESIMLVKSLFTKKDQRRKSIQYSDTGSSGGLEGRFSRDSLPVFSAGGPCEQLWHGQGCPLFVVVHAAFPLPTTASPTLKCALKNGFGEAVVARDMPELCKFPSLDGQHREKSSDVGKYYGLCSGVTRR